MMFEPGPLNVLALRLTVGPPSIFTLLGFMDQQEGQQEFVRIVREFLPEYEVEIMANPLVEQIQAFITRFAERYFPLHESAMWVDGEAYEEITYYVPIQRLGLSYDDYHEIPEYFDTGIQLLTALVESPFDDGESRAPLMDACSEHASLDLLRKIPANGWRPEQLHRALDGTRYEGAALWADILWHQSDSVFNNVTWEDEMYEVDWSRGTIDFLTEEWPKAMEIQDRIRILTNWLEAAPKKHFKELVEAILLRVAIPEPKTLVEVFGGEDDQEARVRVRV